jgi:predicted HAD superfamily phosphohydrolase YqeG
MLQGAQRRSTGRAATPAMVCQLDARDIKLIATDVDGTLLNHKQELTERTARAFQTAASLGIKVHC